MFILFIIYNQESSLITNVIKTFLLEKLNIILDKIVI